MAVSLEMGRVEQFVGFVGSISGSSVNKIQKIFEERVVSVKKDITEQLKRESVLQESEIQVVLEFFGTAMQIVVDLKKIALNVLLIRSSNRDKKGKIALEEDSEVNLENMLSRAESLLQQSIKQEVKAVLKKSPLAVKLNQSLSLLLQLEKSSKSVECLEGKIRRLDAYLTYCEKFQQKLSSLECELEPLFRGNVKRKAEVEIQEIVKKMARLDERVAELSKKSSRLQQEIMRVQKLQISNEQNEDERILKIKQDIEGQLDSVDDFLQTEGEEAEDLDEMVQCVLCEADEKIQEDIDSLVKLREGLVKERADVNFELSDLQKKKSRISKFLNENLTKQDCGDLISKYNFRVDAIVESFDSIYELVEKLKKEQTKLLQEFEALNRAAHVNKQKQDELFEKIKKIQLDLNDVIVSMDDKFVDLKDLSVMEEPLRVVLEAVPLLK